MTRASGSFTGPRRAVWFITGRHGGFSSPPWDSLNLGPHVGDDAATVSRNRELVQDLAGASAVVWAELEHGANVYRVHGPGAPPPADALLTTESHIPLAATAADCATIGLAAPGVIAVAHCGWRGLAAGVVPATIAAMGALGAERIEAVIGPTICGRCYPVDQQRRDACAAGVGEAIAAVACSPAGEEPWIDVAAGVRAQLNADPRIESIVDESHCTVEDDSVFSFRRDGQTGRHAMVVVMNDGA